MPKAAVTAAGQARAEGLLHDGAGDDGLHDAERGAASAPVDVLATYWPIVGSRKSYEIKQAFTERNCDDLIAWYDYALARTLPTQAGVAELPARFSSPGPRKARRQRRRAIP